MPCYERADSDVSIFPGEHEQAFFFNNNDELMNITRDEFQALVGNGNNLLASAECPMNCSFVRTLRYTDTSMQCVAGALTHLRRRATATGEGRAKKGRSTSVSATSAAPDSFARWICLRNA
jgi:hypothetical protein